MLRLALSALAVSLVGCTDGVFLNNGVEGWMQADSGQFVAGSMPGDDGGPKVETVIVLQNNVYPNEIEVPFGGSLDPTADGAAFGLDGDQGYWLLAAGVPDITAPMYPTYSTTLEFSVDLPLGNHRLQVRAVDSRGRFGPPNTIVLDAKSQPEPTGILQVSLRWDTESDLDLRVIDPSGTQIWKRNIDSWIAPPPGTPMDPDAWMMSGVLDVDSNANCIIDGRRREDVTWAYAPPKGHYQVKVDAFSLCGQADARWTVDVVLRKKTIASVGGICLPPDTQLSHDVDGGFFVLGFDVP